MAKSDMRQAQDRLQQAIRQEEAWLKAFAPEITAYGVELNPGTGQLQIAVNSATGLPEHKVRAIKDRFKGLPVGFGIAKPEPQG